MSFARLRIATVVLAANAVGCSTAPHPPVDRGGSAAPQPPRVCADGAAALRALAKPVTVRAFVTRGGEKVDRFVASLEAMLGRWRDASDGKLVVEWVDASDPDGDGARRAREAGLAPIDLGRPVDVSSTVDPAPGARLGVMGLAFDVGVERAVPLPLSPADVGVEFALSSKLREVAAKANGTRHRVGWLVGHGEVTLADDKLQHPGTWDLGAPPGGRPGPKTMKDVITTQFPMFELVDVDLRGGQSPVDASLVGLLVTQPSTDVSDAELRRIDEFVMLGKSLVVAASAVNVRTGDESMQATLSTHGLDRLTAGYGLALQRDVVVERDDAFDAMTVVGGMPRSARVPAVFSVSSTDPLFAPFFRASRVPLPLASSIRIDAARQPGARVRAVARSSATASREESANVDLSPTRAWAPASSIGSVVVAAEATGKLASAFGAGDAKGPARVLVIASSQFFANPFMRAATPKSEALAQLALAYTQRKLTTTLFVTKQTLDWMTAADASPFCGVDAAAP